VREIKGVDFENIAKGLKRHTPYVDRVVLGAPAKAVKDYEEE
jgi:hypothetical protein